MASVRWALVVFITLVSGSLSAQDATELKTQKDKVSYALGMDLGNQFKKQSVDIDPNLLIQGFRDALAGGKLLLTEEEARAAIGELQKELMAKQAELAKVQGEKNLKDGEAFLAANKSKEGVVTLPSGLQYKILQAGAGRKPTIDDTVVCNYRGMFIDGTEFDNSYKRNQPAVFPLKQVIKGWTEALQLMGVGSKWQLWVPSNLAYGEPGRSPSIPPNATLIFEVELISIK